VFKLGKLRQAKLKFANGSYREAMEKLKEGFKIASLKLHFDENYRKRKVLEEKMRKAEEAKKALEAKKPATSGLASLAKKEESKKAPTGTVFSLDALKQDVEDEDAQKKMPNEEFENKKLLPILEEAYKLLCDIEQIKKDADN